MMNPPLAGPGQDYGETSHALKRRKKIALKLGLRKRGKTEFFLTQLLRYFLFQIALKI